MAVWQKSDLQTFAATVEPHVSVLQGDGKTFTKPIPIWAVAVDDMLYARSYLGQKGRWYQAALRHRIGHICAAGITKEVDFDPAGNELGDKIDEAYRAKYGGSPYLAPMIGEEARATTMRIIPRDSNT